MTRRNDTPRERLRRMAASDELAVGRGRSEQLAARALARAVARPRRRAFVAAIAGSAFAVVSVTGVGALADQAAPGEALYAVDRAYESIGRAIGRDYDRTDETLDEAQRIYQRGDRALAIDHLLRELGPILSFEGESSSIDAADAPIPPVDASEAAAASAASETSSTTSTQTTDAAPVASGAATEPAGDHQVEEDPETQDPFLLAIQAAIRARQAAHASGDEEAVAEANLALVSVVKLAAGFAEEPTSAEAPLVLDAPSTTTVPTKTTTVPSTTTTTKAKAGVAGGSNEETATTPSTTTTSVPKDSGGDSPGDDGPPTGDDLGDSQEGQSDPGSGGQSADPGQPPITLPLGP